MSFTYIFYRRLNVNRAQLAKALNVTRATLYNYESGVRRPSLEIAARIMALARANNVKLKAADIYPDIFST